MRTLRKSVTVVVAVVLLKSGVPLAGGRGGERVMWENVCLSPFPAERLGIGVKEGGRDVPPVRVVRDPYPVFNGIAVDGANGVVAVSDGNRKGVLLYERGVRAEGMAVTPPLRQLTGPRTEMGFVAGIAVDPERKEVYVVNNDIEDRLVVFGYEDEGDALPRRVLYVPHQAWGLAVNRRRRELIVSVQSDNVLVFYRQEAERFEAPLRVIGGMNTGLADPRGVAVAEESQEVFVANHGNWRDIPPSYHYQAGATDASHQVSESLMGGRFHLPSIVVYPADGSGDVRPRRVIQGKRTQLNWPLGVAVDEVHQEVVVANAGDDSVLVFPLKAEGDVAPLRVIRGKRTGLRAPVGVAVDPQTGEIWVANFLDHTAMAFERTAQGDVAPRRVIRTAPPEAPALGFINPMAIAYDSRRDELLVPN